MKLKIFENNIIIEKYPYPPSKIFPSAIIHPSNIDCIVKGLNFPTIRTKDGEFIIFYESRPDINILKDYANLNKIRKTNYINIWSLILDVFLDKKHTKEDNERNLEILEKAGLERNKVIEIRKEINYMMLSYNFGSGLWEFAYLDMIDLLDACIGKLNAGTELSNEKFSKFYWEIMKIQDIGKIEKYPNHSNLNH
ncbi:hypothetical protein KKF34_14350 [Myxococcota bacterium]|nr:hypothetical protein [Myxococcota bacterium]MBU1380717.1 hypothetical protein [Myxococcota bacterium]MBU1498055.1 hypothetical protein [Myxococcota bacterium]